MNKSTQPIHLIIQLGFFDNYLILAHESTTILNQ